MLPILPLERNEKPLEAGAAEDSSLVSPAVSVCSPFSSVVDIMLLIKPNDDPAVEAFEAASTLLLFDSAGVAAEVANEDMNENPLPEDEGCGGGASILPP